MFCVKNSILTLSLIKVYRGNTITIRDSNVHLCKMIVSGTKKLIDIRGTSLHRTNIFVEGNRNKVIFESDCEFGHVNIYVLGSNSTIKIGTGSSNRGGMFISCGDHNDIIVGKNCLFAHYIDVFASDSHQILEACNVINTPKSISIGEHVWIGAHCSVMKGVNFGDGAIIGTRTVVTRDVMPNTIHAGSPNKCIKENSLV